MNFKLFLQQNSNNIADCLAENKILLKLAYLCDIFAKLNKLNISMQGPDKNMLDVSDKISAFIKMSLWKKDVENVAGSSQYFYFTVKFAGKEKYDAFFKFRNRIFTASTESPVKIQTVLFGKFIQL